MNEFQSPTQPPSKVAIEINCAIEGNLSELFLIFSVDESKWYQVPMNKTPHSYSISIPNITVGVKILYLFKAIGPNGEEFVENNNGQFFSQIAGSDLVEPTPKPQEEVRERINPSEQLPPIHLKSEPSNSSPSLPPEFSSPKYPSNPFLEPSTEVSKEAPANTVTSGEDESSFDSTQKISSNNQISPSDPTLRPIIAYNPFPADFGDIQESSSPIQSFSNIIGAQLTTLPEKKRSFIKRPEVLGHQPCSHCQAVLTSKWKICPICGNNES